MQQIINFIIKNSHRLLFLLLLGISFSLVIKSHSYHRSEYVNSANAVTGAYYEKVNEVNEYFSLKQKNKDLATENALLKQLLFNKKDTILTSKTLFRNDLNNYNVVVSKVVKNSFNTRENYITINSGTNSGIEVDMGVVNDRGVIGIIEKTSANFSTIQSVLNTKSKINAKIKNSNHFGSLIWDGTNAGFAQLIDVPRLASLKHGDSIVTGRNSDIFPENIPIGKIDKIFIDKKTNYYTINIRLFNDMTALGYVYVDTGAMYRAVAYFAMQHNLVSETHLDKASLITRLPTINLRFQFNPTLGFAEMYLNNENIEMQIRTIEVSRMVSKVAEISEVRAKLVEQQQEMGKDKGIVMDGRDICTVDFPDAELKLFMTASSKTRAQRRFDELVEKGQHVTFEEVLQNVEERDYIDTHRDDSPLVKADDAIEIDNSSLSKKEQFELVLKLVKEKL